MRRVVLLVQRSLLIAFTLISPANSETLSDSNDIHGLWIESRKQKTAVWIEDCDDKLCGRIYWLKKPLSANGKPKRDHHNPDVTLRNRFRCGLRIMSGFVHKKKNSWSGGEIYNPSSGRTYNGMIRLDEEGSLKVRGYIGISLFGKTLKWIRPLEKIKQCG